MYKEGVGAQQMFLVRGLCLRTGVMGPGRVAQSPELSAPLEPVLQNEQVSSRLGGEEEESHILGARNGW